MPSTVGDHALPGRRYPIADASHARNALARVSQFGTASEKARVRGAAHRKFPAIGGRRSLRHALHGMRMAGAFKQT